MKKTNNLLQLCRTPDASESDMRDAIASVSNLNTIVEATISDDASWSYLSSYLIQACENNNIRMVESLLEAGADPNLIVEDDSALWSMQYFDEKTPESDDIRLDITELLLEHGADPYLEINHEKLIYYVDYEVFEEDTDEYRKRFFLYLMAYDPEGSPELVGVLDKTRLKDYRIDLSKKDKEKRICGIITDQHGRFVTNLISQK